MDDLVARLHNALVDALRQRSTRLDQPVTVAEIYQDLIPYRTVRSFGFALNADYEYALLQLLAGEGRLARIEPAEVREELRLELLSPNPNVGMFRQYAACDVFVIAEEAAAPVSDQGEAARTAEPRKHEGATPRPAVPTDWLLREEKRTGVRQQREAVLERTAPVPAEASPAEAKADQEQQSSRPLAQQEAAPSTAVEAPEARAVGDAPAASAVAEDGDSTAPTGNESETRAQFVDAEATQTSLPTVEAVPTGGALEAHKCYGCGMTLPAGRAVRFCPYCGKDQQPKCANCNEDLDPNWRFCVACGTATV